MKKKPFFIKEPFGLPFELTEKGKFRKAKRQKYTKLGGMKIPVFEFDTTVKEIDPKKATDSLAKFGKILIKSANWDKAVKESRKKKKLFG